MERFCYLSIEASSEIVGGGTAAELTTLYCVPWPISYGSAQSAGSRQDSGAYRLTVCVCRAYRSKLQGGDLTSTDLFFEAGDII